jgi:hypothetical protein
VLCNRCIHSWRIISGVIKPFHLLPSIRTLCYKKSKELHLNVDTLSRIELAEAAKNLNKNWHMIKIKSQSAIKPTSKRDPLK